MKFFCVCCVSAEMIVDGNVTMSIDQTSSRVYWPYPDTSGAMQCAVFSLYAFPGPFGVKCLAQGHFDIGLQGQGLNHRPSDW